VVVIRNIWNHRNNSILRHCKIDVEEVFTLAQVMVWAWITTKYPKTMFSYSNWCFSLITCLQTMHLLLVSSLMG